MYLQPSWMYAADLVANTGKSTMDRKINWTFRAVE